MSACVHILDAYLWLFLITLLYFFFSSRRRHTRYWRDWSSDVCSSNLVTGAFNCIQGVAQPMRAQRFGKIVNVASHQAFRPGFGISNYAASKAALIGLTKSAAVDLGPSNIKFYDVEPGFV